MGIQETYKLCALCSFTRHGKLLPACEARGGRGGGGSFDGCGNHRQHKFITGMCGSDQMRNVSDFTALFLRLEAAAALCATLHTTWCPVLRAGGVQRGSSGCRLWSRAAPAGARC